eukprot:1139481-Pelagomonas_calceolata.AAC.3
MADHHDACCQLWGYTSYTYVCQSSGCWTRYLHCYPGKHGAVHKCGMASLFKLQLSCPRRQANSIIFPV